MVTKLSFSTPDYGMAFGLPINTAIARMEATAQALRESAEKAPGRSESPGQRLKAAVKRKLPSRFTATTAPPRAEESESFAEKLTAATKRLIASRMSPRQAREHAEREKARYRKPQRRKPSKSD